MDIYIIRHGQSTGNGLNCFLGWSDHPLTGLGRAQALAVAARLAPLGPLAVICSDLQRARVTAELIAANWGMEVQPDPRWRETHCGRLENCPWDDFAREPGLSERFDIDAFSTPMPDGESQAMMCARVTSAFTDAIARQDANLVIVAHDGPIRAIISHCLQIPPERFWAISTDHGGLTQLRISDGWISVRTVNDTGHLGDLAKAEPTAQRL